MSAIDPEQDDIMPIHNQNAQKPDHTGHRARLKTAYDHSGLSAFAPHEAAELILYSLIPRRDVNKLAHALTDPSGTLDGALKQNASQMEKAGLSPACAAKLKALAACVDTYRECRKNAPLPSPENARELTRRLMARPCPTFLFYGEDGRLAALCPVKGDLTGALSELIIRYNTPLVTLVVPEGCHLEDEELARLRRAAELLGARIDIAVS
jgi:hypothetical protein